MTAAATPYAPAILGALLAVAGLGYAIDAFGSVLFALPPSFRARSCHWNFAEITSL